MKSLKAIIPLLFSVFLVVGCTSGKDLPNAENPSAENQNQDDQKTTQPPRQKNPNSAKPHIGNRIGLNLGGNPANRNDKPVSKPFKANKPYKKRVHKDGKGIIGKTTNEIVDLRKALAENPKLKIVTNRISGSDPLTQSMTAYMALSSRIRMLNFKHDLDIMRPLGDGKPLSFDVVQKRMKIHNIELTMLYAWQKYAYDSKKGDVVILEDPELKAQILD